MLISSFKLILRYFICITEIHKAKHYNDIALFVAVESRLSADLGSDLLAYFLIYIDQSLFD